MTDDAQAVLEAFRHAGKPVRPGDIASMTGMDSAQVSAAIKDLKAQEKIYSPKRCYYALKEDR